MKTWYSKSLGGGQEAFAPTGQIQEAYEVLSIATELPLDCAVFSYYKIGVDLVTVYFSPSAEQLAKAFHATPCQRPENKEGFSLINGSPRAWSLLFPEGRAEE